MTCTAPFRWTSAACSDIGRRELNEDAWLEQPARGLWAVADGMGGHTLGDLASRTVVDCLKRIDAPAGLDDFVTATWQQLQTANRQLVEEAASRQAGIIGSTVVVLLACGREVAYLWAGDSRLYLFRNGRLEQLTRDHNQAEELKSRGEFAVPQGFPHLARNMITRAVGATDSLDIEEGRLRVNDGDIFLLCSDGLSNSVGPDEMAGTLLAGHCLHAAKALIELALQRGGSDNITAVVVRADDLDSTDRTILNPAL